MYISDIIYCAYDTKIYAKNTSGIFFEACALNKIPLISKDTWPGYINKKYNCGIIVDFNSLKIAKKIQKLCSFDINNIKKKLKNNQSYFVKSHGVENFCIELEKILKITKWEQNFSI